MERTYSSRKTYCNFCNMKYDIHYNASSFYRNKCTNINDRAIGHLYGGTHLQKQDRLGFCSS